MQNWVHRWEHSNRVTNIKPPGRSRKTTEFEDHEIVGIGMTKNFASIAFIMDELPHINISNVTFSRRLREHGLHFRFAARKERITPIVANQRIAIATECLNYDPEIWRKTVFIDEASVESTPDGQFRVLRAVNTRYDKQNIIEVQRSGRFSVSFVGCFCYYALGPISFADGRFNSVQFCNYVASDMIPFMEEHYPDSDIYLLYDNAPCHTSLHSQAFMQLAIGNERIIPQAPKSPDTNQMEHI